ncbi:MAG: tRNA (guanine(46)-N(7))-methyltransferase TrmB, partial [Opitutales bacterium]
LRGTTSCSSGDGARVTFELGCGHGHWLAAYGAAHPGETCVGIDLISDRIEKALRKREKGGLANVTFLKAEATEFLDALPAGTLVGATYILYPDPWPKRKHHKNRFIQSGSLDALAARSAPGARLHFRTDDADYHAWTQAVVGAHPRWEIMTEADWPFEQVTFFEERMKARRDVIAQRRD